MRRLKHGTRNMYINGPCRCDDCKRANTDWQWMANRRRRSALEAGLAPYVQHGKRSTFTNYGCRCEPCTEANKRECAAYDARRKANAS